MSEQREQSGWGQRWVDGVEQLSTVWTKQMPRGKDYAAKGHVSKLAVRAGKITARVQGSRSKPYITTLELQPHKSDVWKNLTSALVQQAHWAADMLNGTMPSDVEEHFQDQNLALFPTRNSELLTSCNCPEKSRPCKHIAAVHYAFAEALDGDPFLLFKLRGLDRQDLINDFYRAWFPDATAEQQEAFVDRRNFDEPVLPLSADRFNRAAEEIPEITIHLHAQKEGATLLEQLGVPPSWSLPIPPADILNAVVEKAGELAWELALTDADVDPVDNGAFGEDLESSEDENIDNPLFRSLSATAPAAPVTTENLPTNLPDAALLQGAVGVDLQAEEKNQAKNVTRRKKTTKARTDDKPQPVVLRRRSKTKKDADDAQTAVARRAPSTPANQDAPLKNGAVVTRRKKATPAANGRARKVITTPPGATEQAPPPTVEKVGTPVVRRRTARGGTAVKARRKSPIKFDTAARAAWEAGDAEKTWENALEAWNIEPTDSRYQLLAAAADRMGGITEHFKKIAVQTEATARQGGRMVSTAQLLVLLTAGCYDVATEFIMAMDDGAWLGDDPPGALYLSFLLMALGSELSVPENTCLTKIWGHLFDRGENSFPASDNPPAPVGVWLDFTLQDVPFEEEQEPQYLQVASNLGIGIIEAARERPLSMRPGQIADLAVAVAEALQLLSDESECDRYTGVASARAAADSMLGSSVREAIGHSSLLGFGGGA